jgi:hypothetical protein
MSRLADCQQTILNEIQAGATRKSVAMTYRLAMDSGEAVDWPVVNSAIIARWSMSGLQWIKQQAWTGKCFGGSR